MDFDSLAVVEWNAYFLITFVNKIMIKMAVLWEDVGDV